MADYQRPTKRFGCQGINLRLPVDAMPDGKYPILQNVRPYFNQSIVARPGYTASGTTAGTPVHSVGRLDDPTSFASQPFLRFAGTGANLYVGTVGAFALLTAGFSGNPLTFTEVQPAETPQPWMYVADSNQLKKVRVDSTIYGVGLNPPLRPPTAVISQPNLNIISDFNAVGPWGPIGTEAGAVSAVARINTTVDTILYDTGTTGWALIKLTAMTPNVQQGVLVTLGGAETALIQDVKQSVSVTTIASITYDSGVAGLCTIQPVASVATGSLDTPVPDSARGSSTDGEDLTDSSNSNAKTPHIGGQSGRLIDVGVDCMVFLAAEAVRILSVTVGPDGIQSFRCSTVGTYGAGMAITGAAAIRIFLVGTFAATDTVTTNNLTNTFTPGTPAPAAMTDGITATIAANLSKISTRPTQPDDEIHLSIRIDRIDLVSEVRLYFDVDSATNDFTRNYYFYAIRPNDLTQSLQQANATPTQTVSTSRITAYQQQQLNDKQTIDLGGDNLPNKDITQPSVAVSDPLGGSSGTTSAGAVSGQAASGVSQWSEIRFKVGDLTRVGSDLSRTLANVAAVEITVTAQGSGVINVDYDALWLGGSFGPDVGTIGAPIIYCYRPRSSVTGSVGNPSPSMRSGVSPRRQAVTVIGTQHPNPECDLIDWYRLGGALATWKYVGTSNNSATPVFSDFNPDVTIAANPGLELDNYAPWPTIDLPRKGVVNVSGTAVTWVSGDHFNVNWAQGTEIQINGTYYTLYAQPASTTFLEILENAGFLTNATFVITSPQLLGTALPCWWGDYQGVYFGCGDPNNPGTLYWTKGNAPDVTSDKNSLQVVTPSDTLQNGAIYDGRPFVLSSEEVFEIVRSTSGVTDFEAKRTNATTGLWSRWAITVGPFVWYLGNDGIYQFDGNVTLCITDADLYPLFPHDGVPGVAVNGFFPPNMALPTKLRLTYIDGYLYFDYVDTNGSNRALVCDVSSGSFGWFPDAYTTAILSRWSEEGPSSHGMLLGASNGSTFLSGGTRDNTTPILATVQTPSDPMGDPRVVKDFGDVMIDVDADGSASGVVVSVGFNLNTLTPSAAVIVDPGVSGRRQQIIDVQAGDGYLANDVNLDIGWLTTAAANPKIYLWQPAFVPKGDTTNLRATDWDDAGYSGAKFVQGVIIRADTGGVPRQVQAQFDGGQVGATLTINHDGELELPYPTTNSVPWVPFTAHLIRLIPIDAGAWRLYAARWVYEPAPELATRWITQPTTHDLNGYQHVRDGFLAYAATQPVTLTLLVDGVPQAYSFPATGGAYAKAYVSLIAVKGRYVQYMVESSEGCQVYQKDTEFRVKQWGDGGAYVTARPFGDVSRVSGARI